jgi:hypothetical protein
VQIRDINNGPDCSAVRAPGEYTRRLSERARFLQAICINLLKGGPPNLCIFLLPVQREYRPLCAHTHTYLQPSAQRANIEAAKLFLLKTVLKRGMSRHLGFILKAECHRRHKKRLTAGAKESAAV